MYKAVMFDMDGLVIDTEKYYKIAWIEAAREMGYDMKEEVQLLLRSCSLKYSIPLMRDIFGEDFDLIRVRERRKEIMKELIAKRGIELKPYVREILDFLKKKQVKRVLVTATDRKHTEEYLLKAGIYNEFDKIICADMVENGKPDPDVYIYACEKAEVDPKDCLALEDSPNGVKSAYDAGLSVIMVPDLSEPEGESLRMIKKRVGNLNDVIDFLQEA